MTGTVTNVIPGSQVSFYRGTDDSQGTPAPGCSGVIIAFGNARLLRTVVANNQGVAQVSGNAPRGACGRLYIQAIEQARCLASSLERL